MKHRIALDIHVRKLEEKAQEEHTPPVCSVLLPLPGTPSVPPAGPDDGCFDIFKNVRRLGHTFLNERGERLEFSAGRVLSDKDHWAQSNETDDVASDCSDSGGGTTDLQPEWATRDGKTSDYWPYPSKTVSNRLRAPSISKRTHQLPRCFSWIFSTTCRTFGSLMII